MTEDEPFVVIFYPRLFAAIKQNQALKPDHEDLSEKDCQDYRRFVILFKEFQNKLNSHDESAFMIWSAIMDMWGYSRKYCSMSGKPIVGKPYYIGNKLVSEEYYRSWQLIEKLNEEEALKNIQPVVAKEVTNEEN